MASLSITVLKILGPSNMIAENKTKKIKLKNLSIIFELPSDLRY